MSYPSLHGREPEPYLWQFQCQREGSLFYFQHVSGNTARLMVTRCPICGSKRVKITDRDFKGVDENKPITLQRITIKKAAL